MSACLIDLPRTEDDLIALLGQYLRMESAPVRSVQRLDDLAHQIVSAAIQLYEADLTPPAHDPFPY